MTTLNDLDYLARRRTDSLARADEAVDASVAKVHREFAAHYARLQSEAEAIIHQEESDEDAVSKPELHSPGIEVEGGRTAAPLNATLVSAFESPVRK